MKILFTGGGTLGSVIPLIVVSDCLLARGAITQADIFWIGTKGGPEREAVMRAGIRFAPIITGKLRRYAHWRNFIDPTLVIIGLFQCLYYIIRFQPSVIVNAGSYVGLPVIIAGTLLRVPSVIMQLDVDPVRTNMLTAPFADAICVAFRESMEYFPPQKTVVTGIPVRQPPVPGKAHGTPLPLLYIIGGSTGSEALNDIVAKTIEALSRVSRVVHITGKQKGEKNIQLSKKYPNYEVHEFVGEKALSYLAEADIVVSRAGAGALAELSTFRKPAILIPLPQSPQEHNAAVAKERGAAVVISQSLCTPELFIRTIVDLLHGEERKNVLSQNIAMLFPLNAASRIADIIEQAV